MFKTFAKAVYDAYTAMAANELYVTDAEPDELWAAYLRGFPPGSDPIYKVNTEHTCSTCRQFIRNLGGVVAIINGKRHTIWSLPDLPSPYKEVAAYMDAYVSSRLIANIFRTSEHSFGAEVSRQLLEDKTVKLWDHFHGKVATRHYSATPDKDRGNMRTTVEVFKRGLEELTPESLQTVLSLIAANNLYRGAEFKSGLIAFQTLQQAYLSTKQQNLLLWQNANSPAARLRNTAIGTLLQDLSANVPLEAAVASFEAKVAPTNYKRTTALITPRMIEDATATIKELGLESALHRRYAKLADISVNNVLWVNNTAKAQMRDSITSLLLPSAKTAAPKVSAAQVMHIADFMVNVLPTASSIDMLVENRHTGNFMSLTAPVYPDALPLFKWANNFGWSYAGNITDSIKERVKAAGGTVEGDVCCRLAWDNTNDLDFHMSEPSGNTIYFSNRKRLSSCGGMLDVDANGLDGVRNDPAENIFYADKHTMRPGTYSLSVHHYSGSRTGGFTVQVEIEGVMHTLVHEKSTKSGDKISVAAITVAQDRSISFKPYLPSTSASINRWGIKTQDFTPVSTVMFSPNFWDGATIGNKHWFFMLDGCKNNEPTRGMYNEFLGSGLEQHRKVFEVLGDKLQCPPSDEQLSGLGFSSTKADSVTLRVDNRLYVVNF